MEHRYKGHIMSADALAPYITKSLAAVLTVLDEQNHAGLILGLRPANERRRYFVTTSLIGWAQA